VRIAILWIALVIGFAAVYSWYEPPRRAKPEVAHREDDSSGSWGWLAIGGSVVLVVGTFLWTLSGSRRFNARQKPGLDAISDGRYAHAAQLFGDLARRYRTKPNFAMVASYNHAFAAIRTGDSAAAVGLLLRIDRWPLPQLQGLRGPVALELARAFAIGGEVEKAERWLDTAQTRLENDPRGNHEEAIALVEGLIRCRAGRFEDALRHYDDRWQRLQAKLTVRDMQEAWLLRAFAVSKTSAPRDGAAAEPWLRLLRGTEPGSLAWLTRHWPELAVFVDLEVRAASARAATPPSAIATPAAD
jgi:tetratricopeptide (TPR) repeat protein